MPDDKKRVILTEKGKEFLRKLRLKNGLPLTFKKKYGTIIHWENGRSNATLNLFQDYIGEFNIALDYFKINNFIKEIRLSSQETATLKATKIPKEKHEFIIKDYQSGLTLETISKKYNCHFVTIFYILKKYKIDMSKHGSGENYHFPESEYIKELEQKGITPEKARPLISSLLFTDGCLCKTPKTFEISYYGYDKTLHNIFADLIWYCFKKRPSSYMIRCGKVFRTKYIDKQIIKKMLELSSTYKTKPAPKQEWKDFMEELEKPTLKFLDFYDLNVLKEVARLAMCADGSISVSKKENRIFFTLMLACAHPSLVKEWSILFNNVGIKNNIVGGCAKTHIGGVKGIEDCLFKFKELGGFIKGVQVCVRHSPFCGIEKQKILLKATELLKEQKRINTLNLEFDKFKKLIQ